MKSINSSSEFVCSVNEEHEKYKLKKRFLRETINFRVGHELHNPMELSDDVVKFMKKQKK